jgi:hypothetical protein
MQVDLSAYSKQQIKTAERLISDKSAFGESLILDETGQPIKYFPYQREFLQSTRQRKLMRGGRGVGKSVALLSDNITSPLTNSHRELVAAPGEAALRPLIEDFKYQIDNNPRLALTIKSIVTSPYFEVQFKCGSVVYYRPAGQHGKAFRGIHVDVIRADEYAYFSAPAAKALMGALKIGSKRLSTLASTCNGQRDREFYRLSKSNGYEQYHWPSQLNPGWDAETEAELLEYYGGRNTPGWQHEVDAEHGMAMYGAFDMRLFEDCYTEIPEYQVQSISSADFNIDLLPEILRLNSFEPGDYILGADLGYTSDPAEVVISRLIGNIKRHVFRLHMDNIKYPDQIYIINYIMRNLNVIAGGIDAGNNGIAVHQGVLALSPQLADRLFAIPFGGTTQVGLDEKTGKPLMAYNKELMTQLINGALSRGEWQIPCKTLGGGEDEEVITICADMIMESQYNQHSVSSSGQNGRLVYSKGNDHIIDADRCAAYAEWYWRINGLQVWPTDIMLSSSSGREINDTLARY